MRALVQRVREASVEVAGREISRIGPGMLVLLGVASTDAAAEVERLAAKVAGLRMFEDFEGKMNLDIAAAGGAVLCVSQFTLHADVRRGTRPSFDRRNSTQRVRRSTSGLSEQSSLLSASGSIGITRSTRYVEFPRRRASASSAVPGFT